MSIKRYVASSDNTITNAFKENLSTRATGSNMGESDVLEVFSIYAQATTSSVEQSRIMLKFPIDTLISDRQSGLIPANGNVKFFLKLSNTVHPFTVPKKFTLNVLPISGSWDEGSGLDMESYLDSGYCNWEYASVGQPWVSPGSDTHNSPSFSQYFEKGTEDLKTEITSLVEEWISGTKNNDGVLIKLIASQETGSNSYYTKKFFARGSEYFFKRPWIEAQFDSSKKDNRNSFFKSSSLAPAQENLNTLYLYNRHRGNLVNIPAVGTGQIYVSLYSGTTGPSGSPLVLGGGLSSSLGGYLSTGVYTASLSLDSALDHVFDVWHNNAGTIYSTGSLIKILDPREDDDSDYVIPPYSLSMPHLKKIYKIDETARFNLFVKNKEWHPTVYNVAASTPEGVSIENSYYKIFRVSDNLDVIPFGTGSMKHTRLSFDGRYNYFDLDISMLEPGYTYGIKYTFTNSNRNYEQGSIFKFRVEE